MTKFNMYACPTCGDENTIRRTGSPWFDGERYCYGCRFSYDPYEEAAKYLEKDEERKRLEAKERLIFITDRD